MQIMHSIYLQTASILLALHARGFLCAEEVGRQIIREQIKTGVSHFVTSCLHLLEDLLLPRR